MIKVILDTSVLNDIDPNDNMFLAATYEAKANYTIFKKSGYS